MENAVEALKMAAAILIFIGALSLAIFGLTKASQAAGRILSKQDEEYYNIYDNNDNVKVLENRIVGIETVIPTLYSYFKEDYTILFYTGSVDETGKLTGEIDPLPLYYSEALPDKLKLSTLTVNGGRYIYGMDKDDEDTRKEPWLNDEIHAKNFISSLVNNNPENYKWPWSRDKVSGSPNVFDYYKKELTFKFEFTGSLTNKLKSNNLNTESLSTATDAKFVERIGVYNEKMSTEDANSGTQTNTSDSVIEFSNNEVIENEEGTQKRVIQYVLVD